MTPAASDKDRGNVSYRIVPGQDEGWDVVLERQPGVLSSTHCSDWHRVERLCGALRIQEARRPETPPATPA